jgi:hypothetical protein
LDAFSAQIACDPLVGALSRRFTVNLKVLLEEGFASGKARLAVLTYS